MSTALTKALLKGGSLPARRELVFQRGGVVLADRVDVAAYFGKRRDHVLRDIRSLIEQGVPNFGEAILRPKLLKLLASLGVTPQVDAATGEIMVEANALIKALGLTEEEAMAAVRPEDVTVVPVDRLRPLQ